MEMSTMMLGAMNMRKHEESAQKQIGHVDADAGVNGAIRKALTRENRMALTRRRDSAPREAALSSR